MLMIQYGYFIMIILTLNNWDQEQFLKKEWEIFDKLISAIKKFKQQLLKEVGYAN